MDHKGTFQNPKQVQLLLFPRRTQDVVFAFSFRATESQSTEAVKPTLPTMAEVAIDCACVFRTPLPA